MNKAGEALKWLMAGLMGGGITFAFLYLLGANVSIPFYQKPKQETASKTYPDFEPLEPTEAPRKTAEEIFWENIAADERRKAEENSARQTSFNDQNYQARQIDNTYSPQPQRQIASATTERRANTVSRERTSKWIKSWNGGTNYLAEWMAVNNYIDGSSVCANHRRGSIDYRECRKAAKQHFHEECRSWDARHNNDRKDHSHRMKTRYCSAASSFSPMG